MTLRPTRADSITRGDLIVFAGGQAATVKLSHTTASGKVRVVFTDPSIRYAPCPPDTMLNAVHLY